MADADARLKAAFTDAQYRAAEMPDSDYYREQATAADGPVLELGCGTGRVYLAMLRAGVDADGIDLSAASLSVLRENAAEEGLEPTVWQGDMTQFTVDRAYALAICPFNALQELRSVDNRLAALDATYDALAPGGSFVFDLFVPDFEFICGTYGEWQTETVTFRGDEHEVRARTSMVNEPRQVFEVEREAFDPDGELLFAEDSRATMLPRDEVELLARASPFEGWHVTGGFSDEPLADGHTKQVWTLEKTG
jgi:SAM-dependent methyltransferase